MDDIDNNFINNIISVLKKNSNVLTITNIVDITELSRSAVRTTLAKLEGGNKVIIKKIGMAKLYSLKK
jgi:DNA-binding transcriptional ArsR family regulator